MIIKPQRAQSTQRKNSPLWSLCPLWLIFFYLSCATASIHQSIENIEPQWENFSDGIDYLHGKLSSPKIEFWALKVDLSSPNINIAVKSEAGTVSSFVRSNNLITGINTTPFEKNRENIGLVISDGVVLSEKNANYDALVFYKDGYNTRAIIVSQATIFTTVNIDNAVGGFRQILKDREPVQRIIPQKTDSSAPRHPRTAAGVSPNNDVLYLICIDGRRSGSIGTTEFETALLLRALGSNDGINFDGGGSTTMVLRFPDGKVRVLNRPSDFGKERVVAAGLGIR